MAKYKIIERTYKYHLEEDGSNKIDKSSVIVGRRVSEERLRAVLIGLMIEKVSILRTQYPDAEVCIREVSEYPDSEKSADKYVFCDMRPSLCSIGVYYGVQPEEEDT